METTTRRARPRTIHPKRMGVRRYALRVSMEEHWRPTTREECRNGPRPCPYVGCRWNLYLDVTSTGGIKLNFPDVEPEQMCESCALDVAERGEADRSNIAAMLNLSEERVRQIETNAIAEVIRNADEMDVPLRALLLNGEEE